MLRKPAVPSTGDFSPHLLRPGELQIALVLTGRSFPHWHRSHSPTASDVIAQHCRSSAKSPCCGHASPIRTQLSLFLASVSNSCLCESNSSLKLSVCPPFIQWRRHGLSAAAEPWPPGTARTRAWAAFELYGQWDLSFYPAFKKICSKQWLSIC